jgi:hypothetical protein
MDKTKLVSILKNRFSEGGLRELCLYLNIDYEHISGTNSAEKALGLVIYMGHRNRIEDLYEACIQLRPDVLQSLPDQQTHSQLTKSSNKLSILFLVADPTDASRLRLGEELRQIQEQLSLAKLREKFEFHQRMSVRPTDISQALLDIQPQIVHFSGHGTKDGALCFENKIGEVHLIQPDALAALFEQFANKVYCIVLNACYSEIQAQAIATHINYVIGMNQSISDRAAIAFTIGFYQALGAARTIDEAYKLGCIQIRLQGIPEHLTPVLIKNGTIQP